MNEIIIELDKEKGGFVGLQDGRVIVRDDTQTAAGDRGHDLRPNATILAARVKYTEEGKPDQFRKLHGPKRT